MSHENFLTEYMYKEKSSTPDLFSRFNAFIIAFFSPFEMDNEQERNFIFWNVDYF